MRIYEFILDIILPLDAVVQKLETMTAAEIMTTAKSLNRDREIPKGIILFEYKDLLIRTAIAEIKFRGNRKIATLIGGCVRDTLIDELSELKTFENFSNPLLVSVPMTRQSLRARGWNQCHLMLEPVISEAKNIGLEINFDALKKIRETRDQVGKDRKDRLVNLEGCFEANEKIVHGRNVIVFDDVVTTGATWEETKRALRKAGARKVILLAVAH